MAQCRSGAPHLRLALGPSATLRGLSALAHAGAAAVALVCDLPLWCLGPLGLALLSSHLRLARCDLGLAGDGIGELEYSPEGLWQVTTRTRAPVAARLREPAFVHPGVAVLGFRLADGRRRSAVLLPDNCDAEAFRLLRIRLRRA